MSNTTLKFVTEGKILSRAGELARSAKTLRDNVHAWLCSYAGHVYMTGDTRGLVKLLDGTKGLDRKVMMQWCRDNAFVRFIEKDGTVSVKVNANAKDKADFDSAQAVFEYLITQPAWYEGCETVSDIVKDVDVAKAIEALAKRLEAARVDPKKRIIHSTSRERDALLALEHAMRPQAGNLEVLETNAA